MLVQISSQYFLNAVDAHNSALSLSLTPMALEMCIHKFKGGAFVEVLKIFVIKYRICKIFFGGEMT